MINGTFVELLTVGPAMLPNSSYGYFQVPEYIIWIDILRRWQNSHNGSLICGDRTVMVGKAKWKPWELVASASESESEHHHIAGGIVEVSAAIKDWKDSGVLVKGISPLNYLALGNQLSQGRSPGHSTETPSHWQCGAAGSFFKEFQVSFWRPSSALQLLGLESSVFTHGCKWGMYSAVMQNMANM